MGKKLFVMPHTETEIPEKKGDKEYMEKSNIHLIVETKEKKWGKGNMYIFVDKMTKNYPIQSYECPLQERKKEKWKRRRKVWAILDTE